MSILIGLPMPQPGETIAEGTVVKWLKQAGDVVAENEPVVELETAKAVYDYESPIAGTIKKILVAAGSEQKVGQPLAIMDCDETLAKKYLRLGVGLPINEAGDIVHAAKADATVTPMTTAPSTTSRDAKAMPAVRSMGEASRYAPFILTLARDHGMSESELAHIPGTGLGGRLRKEDLLAYVAHRPARADVSPLKPASTTLPTPLPGSRRIEPDALRRRIAQNMTLSKTTIPHAGTSVDVDMTELIALRERAKTGFEKTHGAKLRLAPFFVFAVREALKQYPGCNNFYFIDGEGKHWIEEHPHMNLGIAVGTPRGLMVPVLKHAEGKDFLALAKESDALMQKALDGKLKPDELSEATVTINNPGALGSVRGNQVIAYPQSIIVGFQAVVERACFVGGHCVPRPIMALDLSFDHRIIDGVEAVGFLMACKATLENPGKAFTELS